MQGLYLLKFNFILGINFRVGFAIPKVLLFKNKATRLQRKEKTKVHIHVNLSNNTWLAL